MSNVDIVQSSPITIAPLGPVTEHVVLSGSGSITRMAEGGVSAHPTFGTVPISSPILTKWALLNAEATADGSSVQDYLGAAVAAPFTPKVGGEAQYYERGMIAVRKDGKSAVVYGGIYGHYRELGGPDGFLGLPQSDEAAVGGGRRSIFDGGDIIWSEGTGAHSLHGSILARYNAMGGPTSPLGLPTSDEQPVIDNGREVGRFNTFANADGGIWWTPQTGAWEVYGTIGDCWRNQYGGPVGPLGFPLCGETDTPDLGGRYNDFVHGIIVWHGSGPLAGVWPVFGLDFFLDHFESNFDPYHVQIKADFSNPVSPNDRWFPSDSDFASDPSPKWHATIPIVHHDTALDVWMDGIGHHTFGKDERLGVFQAQYDIRNLWGLLDHTNPHSANQNQNSDFHFNCFFTISTPLPSARGPFTRETQWWPFHNFETPVLSYDQMAQTFTDVHEDEATLFHPFDSIFYNDLYKTSAKGGNCFGMCLEALYAHRNRSMFPEPITNNPFIQYPAALAGGGSPTSPADARFIEPVNIKFGYQLGSPTVAWSLAKYISGAMRDPVGVFHETQASFNAGQSPILSITSGGIGSDGHAVVPYRWDSSSKPWRIFIANPNTPISQGNDDASSNICFIDPDQNTFRINVGGTETWSGGRSGGGLIMNLPFHLFANEPSTPFWDVMAALSALALVIILGDGTVTQIGDGHGRTFFKPGSREINLDPASRLPDAGPMPFFNRRDPASPFDAYCISRMPPLRRAGQTAPAPDLDEGALQLHYEVTPVRSGAYRWAMRSHTGSAVVEMSGGPAKDLIRVDQFARGTQAVMLASTGSVAKTASVTMTGAFQTATTHKSFLLSKVAIAAGTTMTASLENAGQELVLQNTGPAMQVGLVVQSGSKASNVAARPTVAIEAGSITRLKPVDWSEDGIGRSAVSAETLDRVGGKVIHQMMI